MSKKLDSVPNVSYGYGYVVSQDTPNAIVGRIIGIIEACGLSEKQEESVKHLVKGAVWQVFEDATNITPERHTELRTLWHEKRREANSNNIPMSAI